MPIDPKFAGFQLIFSTFSMKTRIQNLSNSSVREIFLKDGQNSNIFVAEHKVSRQQRGIYHDVERKFRGCVVWFTGLSGAGKSTVAMGVEKELVSRGNSSLFY